MQEKTMSRTISQAMGKFIISLPLDLRKPVSENLFVAGGAIASLALQYPVSDYDVYIADPDVLERLCNYMVDKFLKEVDAQKEREAGNHTHPMMKVIRGEDDRVRIHIQSAGVASTTEEKGAYDYFETVDPAQGAEWVQTVVAGADFGNSTKIDYRPTFFTENAITLGNAKIQIITRFSGKPDEVVNAFDFHHTKNYWKYTNTTSSNPNNWTGEIVWRKDALIALLTRTLQYSGSAYPLCALIRTRKFLQRGFKVPVDIYVRLAFELNQLDLTNPRVLQNQLIGVDFAYFSHLISLIQADVSRDPDMTIDNTYICQLLDEMEEVDLSKSLQELNVMQQEMLVENETS